MLVLVFLTRVAAAGAAHTSTERVDSFMLVCYDTKWMLVQLLFYETDERRRSAMHWRQERESFMSDINPRFKLMT
jgi:hypothetical protein